MSDFLVADTVRPDRNLICLTMCSHDRYVTVPPHKHNAHTDFEVTDDHLRAEDGLVLAICGNKDIWQS